MLSAPDEPSYLNIPRTDIEPLLPPATPNVLEVGCYAGGTMAWLRGIRPVDYAAAIELSSSAAATARAVFDDVEVGDAASAHLDFKVDQFDLILALDVLEHLTDAARVVRMLRDHLAPNGTMVVSLPNIAHFSVSLPLLTPATPCEYGFCARAPHP